MFIGIGMQNQQILPIVLRLKAKIDLEFINHIGPIGKQVYEETWEELLSRGRMRPSSLLTYIDMLAAELTNASQKTTFSNQANKFLKFI